MSNADRVQLAYKVESSFGTAPTGVNYQLLRFTGETFGQQTDTTTSQEIRADRQIPDLIRNNMTANGDLSFEFSKTMYDEFLAAAIGCAAFAPTSASVVASITIAGSGPTWTLTRAAGNWVSDGYVANMWITVAGSFVSNPTTFVAKITNVTTTQLTIKYCPTLVAEGPIASVHVNNASQGVNGVANPSFTFERLFTDLTNKYAVNAGMCVSGLSLDVTTNGILTGKVSFIGKNETSYTSARGSGFTAAPTGDVMNAIDNVYAVLENGTAIGLTKFSLNINANLRNRLQIASLGPISIGQGRVEVSGSLEGYFTDPAIIDKYINFTSTSLVLIMKDSSSHYYAIELPKVKFKTGKRNSTATNTDVMMSLDFAAIREPTEDVTIRIATLPAP